MHQPSISTQIYDEVFSAVETIGVERTIKALQEAKSNSLILNDLNIEFILASVSEIMCIPKDRILHGRERTDDRKIALALCVYFIKTEFNYSLSEIKKIFNKDESALSRYHSLVENIPEKPKTDFDKKLDGGAKRIKLLIVENKLACKK